MHPKVYHKLEIIFWCQVTGTLLSLSGQLQFISNRNHHEGPSGTLYVTSFAQVLLNPGVRVSFVNNIGRYVHCTHIYIHTSDFLHAKSSHVGMVELLLSSLPGYQVALLGHSTTHSAFCNFMNLKYPPLSGLTIMLVNLTHTNTRTCDQLGGLA